MNILLRSSRQKVKAILVLIISLSVLVLYYFLIPAIKISLDFFSTNGTSRIQILDRAQGNFLAVEEIRLLKPLHLIDLIGKDLKIIEVSEPTETQFEEGVKQIDQIIIVEGDFQSMIHFQYGIDTLRSNCGIRYLKLYKDSKTGQLTGEFHFTSIYPNPEL